jgi:hypothetical protein
MPKDNVNSYYGLTLMVYKISNYNYVDMKNPKRTQATFSVSKPPSCPFERFMLESDTK